MDIGFFTPPYAAAYAAGERTARQVIEWDLQLARWADEYGLAEIFFTEHHTIGHEPSPAPDLMIAAASQHTERIRLGAAAHLLPYHNPMALADRLIWLDHMTGGRYIAGFAPGSFPTDGKLFGVGASNSKMMDEAIDIIDAIWRREGPFRIDGDYWTVEMPEYSEQWNGPHLSPLQRPHPEIVMTGIQTTSPTFIDCGRRGYSPMSQQVGVETLRRHWDTYSAAAEEGGHTPDRANWRVLRDIFVADTDEEARRLVVEGEAGKTWEELVLPTFRKVRDRGHSKAYALGELLIDPGMTVEDLTVDWMVDNFFIVGSPDTVVEKIAQFNEEVGGLGALLSFVFDYSADPEPYRRNFELLGTEVAPRVATLGPRAGTLA
jgi:alkanesulfonate monooxygenase SsuD/methylene tetrahydromethanopterin reductase-like flavin-dependent oxidoreductase (luciferase family)